MIEHPERPIADPSPEPRADANVSAAAARQIIVPLPADFDLESAFQSEAEMAAQSEDRPRTPGDTRPTMVEATVAETDEGSPAPPSQGPAVSVADLLENNVRLDWQEAVAIAQQLCRTMAQDPAANVQRAAVEPWNVEITGSGDIQILPGGTSSDPLVQQVGRVLRALLRDSIAPAELRLIAAQASFDVPVFSTVEELAQALRRFERPGESASIRTAFQKGVDAKFSHAPSEVVSRNLALTHVVVQENALSDIPPYPLMDGRPRWGLLAAAFAAFSMVLIALNVVRSREPIAVQTAVAAASLPAPTAVPPPPATAGGHSVAAPVKAATAPALPVSKRSDSHRERTPSGHVAESASAGTPAVVAAPTPRPPVRAHIAPPAVLSDEQRALGLIDEGRADEAAIIFDSIVFKNPSYRLNSEAITPDAIDLFRRSKQTLLPGLARNHYDSAKRAFDNGDFTRAIAECERASALLNDTDVTAPADLRADVSRLHATAIAARTTLEERIYSSEDAEVQPPRPIGRQLPALQPPGANPQSIGRLEILVSRSGQVEMVRLHTPSNAYHDRMIVSAAKAWHYRPALRNGKPVRFNLVMMINLPESE